MELWISKWSYGSQNGVMDLEMELWISKWSYGSQNGVIDLKMPHKRRDKCLVVTFIRNGSGIFNSQIWICMKIVRIC